MHRLPPLGILLPLLLMLVGLLAGTSPARAADPFGRSGGAASESAEPGLFSGLMAEIAARQRAVNQAVSSHMQSLAETGSLAEFGIVLGLSFVYGVLHAAGPGHGKAVVATYFLARREAVVQGFLLGGGISLIQGVSAIVMVAVLKLLLDMASLELTGHTVLVEAVSYGLICLIGLYLLLEALRGGAHHHHHHHGHSDHHGHDHGGSAEGRRPGAWMTLAAGLVPCTSAIILLLFALANNAFLIGVAAVAALSLGMAVTVSAIGLAVILARNTMARLAVGGGHAAAAGVERGLGLLGAGLLIAFAGLLLLGALERL